MYIAVASSNSYDVCTRHHAINASLYHPAVWDVHFHPINPNHLFTCSNDGCLWHWDATKVTSSMRSARDSAISPWLMGDVLANGMDVINSIPNNILPINSLDILSKHLVAGADSEAIYVISDMIVS